MAAAEAKTTLIRQITPMERSDHAWTDLVGLSDAELEPRFGAPASRRETGGALWLVYETGPGRLRVRCAQDAVGTPRVASWTVTFREPRDTLASAAGAVGLWPDAAPDAIAAEVKTPLVRRSLRGPDAREAPRSLTATLRAGQFDRLSVFDEPPDWL